LTWNHGFTGELLTVKRYKMGSLLAGQLQ